MKRPMAPRRYWTAAELRKLRRKFPTTKTADLAREFGRHPSCVSHKAYSLGLSKAPEYLADTARSGRTNGQRGLTTRFKPGQAPWNKGRKGWKAGGRAVQAWEGHDAYTALYGRTLADLEGKAAVCWDAMLRDAVLTANGETNG